jgi:hypothetical protein
LIRSIVLRGVLGGLKASRWWCFLDVHVRLSYPVSIIGEKGSTFNNHETFVNLYTGMMSAFGSSVGRQQFKQQALEGLRDDELLKEAQKLE